MIINYLNLLKNFSFSFKLLIKSGLEVDKWSKVLHLGLTFDHANVTDPTFCTQMIFLELRKDQFFLNWCQDDLIFICSTNLRQKPKLFKKKSKIHAVFQGISIGGCEKKSFSKRPFHIFLGE
jgi:hypothetical protein